MPDIDHESRVRLPSAVYDLARRLGVCPERVSTGVTLTQTGRIKRKINTEAWMSFTARQTISTSHCAFDWRARFGPLGILSVRDAVDDHDAHLDITLLGFIPIAHGASSPALIRGKLMRYLAELAWAPDAILCNTALRWRVDGPYTLAVSAGIAIGAAEVILGLDSDGRIASAFAPDRSRSATAPFLPTPWRGRDRRKTAHHRR